MLLVLPADHVIRDVAGIPARRCARRSQSVQPGRPGDLRHRRALTPRPATATSSAAQPIGAVYRIAQIRREAESASARRVRRLRASTTGTAACSCSARAATWRNWSAWRRRLRRLCRTAFEARPADLDFTRIDARRLSRLPQRLDRLCGHGEDRRCGGGAAGCRLERCRLLVGAARGERRRCARQCRARRCDGRGHARAATCIPRAAWSRPWA